MKKTVYIVTHGNKNPGPNPSMTDDGVEQVRKLRQFLPAYPAIVVCGTGRRHIDVRHALGFENIENERTVWTPLVGGPESLENISGQDMVMLADGAPPIPLARYLSLSIYGVPVLLSILRDVLDDSVICSGRPAMMALGVKDAKSAAVYRINIYCQGITGPLTLDNLQIQEVKALGEAEAGSV